MVGSDRSVQVVQDCFHQPSRDRGFGGTSRVDRKIKTSAGRPYTQAVGFFFALTGPRIDGLFLIQSIRLFGPSPAAKYPIAERAWGSKEVCSKLRFLAPIDTAASSLWSAGGGGSARYNGRLVDA